ncbi:MAG: prepilin-type N-terminal cleavage/methylation domain-containing protein [Thermodesulfobacteriota bacterium]|nr:prepilin-type N-terminal cleavage/methylation domain-containing protein [Thermodesulfobacteriota bacterium]
MYFKLFHTTNNFQQTTFNTKGFTLLELMLVLAIINIMLLGIYGGVRLGVKSWESSKNKMELAKNLGILSSIIEKQIGSALPLILEKDNETKVVAFTGNREFLSFFAPTSIDPKKGNGLYMVTYFVKGNDKDGKCLFVREKKTPDKTHIQNKDLKIEESLKLMENIEDLSFKYYSAKTLNFKDSWTDDDRETMPYMVKIDLSFISEGKIYYRSITIPILQKARNDEDKKV